MTNKELILGSAGKVLVAGLAFAAGAALAAAPTPPSPAAAIQAVLDEDSRLGSRRNHAPESMPLARAIEAYVKDLEAIDFGSCPADFTAAFARHRDAWRESIQVLEEFPEMRGELHDLFDRIRELGPESRVRIEAIEERIWSTWAEVEAAVERHGGGDPARSPEAAPATASAVLESSAPDDWMPLDPANTLVMTLPGGRVVIRLAPRFAPRHVANLKALVAERYFDGLAVVRSQENYVVQWGDPDAEGDGRREIERGKPALAPEFDRPLDADLPLTPLPDGDVYAPQVGFVDAFPVAVDRERGRVWLAHCHGMVGAGRAEAADSGSGAELYAVIGHSPRHLDLNVTLVGRVVQGIEVLSTLPRGTGGLGFYEDRAEQVEIESIRLGSELPPAERVPLEILRTDTPTFERLIAARRHRTESWFVHPTGRVSLCNVPLPVRRTAPGSD